MTTLPRVRNARAETSPDILAHVPVDRTTGVPLHRQIYDGIRGAILRGSLRPGQRLPSTRTLAREVGVSRLPVLGAYEQLLHEGYFETRAGSGTYVTAALPDDRMRAIPLSRLAAAPTVRRAPAGKAHASEDVGLRPFRMSVPGLDVFPHRIWARIVARHAHAMAPARMAYGNPAGVKALRVAIAEYVRTSRAVRCEADQVLIVSGSQAALRLCASVLLAHGDSIAIEDPGYPGARAAFDTSDAAIVPVPVDGEGIDVAALSSARPRPRAVYVTPSHQYPLGMSMSAARRLALLEWAERRSAWIIEDDYDSEYRYVSRPLGALQGIDDGERVIYIGTMSKVLFPALRLGYVIVPRALWPQFVTAREALDLFSPVLYQLALVDFLREGHFARHVRRMHTHYASRRAALVDGLSRHCRDTLVIYNADAGLHVSALLARGVDDVGVVRQMADEGLMATALSTCYVGSAKRSGLLLGFGGWTERRILDATKALGDVLSRRR